MVNADTLATGNDLDELEDMTLDPKSTDQNGTEVCLDIDLQCACADGLQDVCWCLLRKQQDPLSLPRRRRRKRLLQHEKQRLLRTAIHKLQHLQNQVAQNKLNMTARMA